MSTNVKYVLEIDLGGVRMDSYGSVWTRMGPYGPWGLPGGFLGPPGALGGPERGVKGGSPPGGARGALLGGLPISLRGILTYMPLRAAYGMALWPAYGISGILTWTTPSMHGFAVAELRAGALD